MSKPSKARIRDSFERAAPTYDSAADIQRRICAQLADGLPWKSLPAFAKQPDTAAFLRSTFGTAKLGAGRIGLVNVGVPRHQMLTPGPVGRVQDQELDYDYYLAAAIKLILWAAKREQAVAELEALVRERPDDPIRVNALGYTLTDAGARLPEASVWVRRAFRLAPDEGFITDSLGWLYFRQGRVAEALGLLLRASRALPGDPAAFFAGAAGTAEAVEEIRVKLGLDKSLPQQFVVYVRDLAHGDWGTSHATGQPVLTELATRLPASLELTLVGLLLATGVAWTSEPGKRFFIFGKDSVAEAKRVVWPTRKETLQTTGIVILFAITMALFLWLVDASLMMIVNELTGRGE